MRNIGYSLGGGIAMIESLQLFAEYNRAANEKLRRVLWDLDNRDVITEDAGAYYGSILGILNHIAVSELRVLQQLRQARDDFESLEREIIAFTFSSFHQKLYSSVEEWAAARAEIDSLMITLAEELSPQDARSRFTLTSYSGRNRTVGIGEMLFHLFNHATHHRGQVSQILDSRNVPHDFSSFVATTAQH